MEKERRTTWLLLIIYMIILTWIILFKMEFSFGNLPHIRNINLIPFRESVIVNERIDFDEIFNNLLVFIPIGIYVAMLKTNWNIFKKIIPAIVISLSFETLQFIFGIGASDITDLIMNTLGGAAGVGIGVGLLKVLKGKGNRILNILASICTVLIIGFMILILTVTQTGK